MRLLLLTSLIWVLFSSTPSWGLSPKERTTITILHTNDMHARYLPREASWVKEEPRPSDRGIRAALRSD